MSGDEVPDRHAALQARRLAVAGDDGSPDARLTAALASWRAAPGRAARAEVLAALSGARVFLALAARAIGVETSERTGLRQESGAEMLLLLLARPDGERVLPAFPDGHAVQRWRPEARPVPVPGPEACGTAISEGAVGLLLDPPGAALVVGPDELAALAAGRVPVVGSGLSARRTDAGAAALRAPRDAPPAGLLAALADALGGEPVRAARLLEGPDGLALGVVPERPLDPAALAALAGRVARRIGPAMPPDGLDLTVVAAAGEGLPVPLGRRRWRLRR